MQNEKVIDINTRQPKQAFFVGQLVWHKRFQYRGVIIGADLTFKGTQEWYDYMARSKPPKNRPWYHVLVDGADHTTYVAERNLEPDHSSAPIRHPLVEEFFHRFENGRYFYRRT